METGDILCFISLIQISSKLLINIELKKKEADQKGSVRCRAGVREMQ